MTGSENSSETQEESDEKSLREKENLVRIRQYEFEKKQAETIKESMKGLLKPGIKRYFPWIIVSLVVLVLILLLFIFNII